MLTGTAFPMSLSWSHNVAIIICHRLPKALYRRELTLQWSRRCRMTQNSNTGESTSTCHAPHQTRLSLFAVSSPTIETRTPLTILLVSCQSQRRKGRGRLCIPAQSVAHAPRNNINSSMPKWRFTSPDSMDSTNPLSASFRRLRSAWIVERRSSGSPKENCKFS